MAYECRYIGPDLADLAGEAVRAATSHAERQIASSATRPPRLYDVAVAETPVLSGRARASWIQHDIEPHGSGYEGRVTNSDDVAAFLEQAPPRSMWAGSQPRPEDCDRREAGP
jgi:hypothetical protein